MFALLLGLYGLNRIVSRGKVMGSVEVASTPLGGLDTDQALSAVLGVEEAYSTRPAIFTLDGKVVNIVPSEAGLDLDDEAIVADAMAVGREGNPISQFFFWLNHLFTTVEIPVQGSVDHESLEAVYDTWDSEVIADPAIEGGIDLTEEGLVPSYPAPGSGVNRPAATAIVEASLLAEQPDQGTIPMTTVQPDLTDADVDAAMAEAQQLLSDSIVMSHDGTEVTFTTDELAQAFISETVSESPARIVNGFDPAVIDELLEPVRADFEEEPVNAKYEISGDDISIVPGENGTRIDPAETSLRMRDAGLTESRSGELPLVEGAEPDRTTEYLESLDIEHLVSQFTTYHKCCEPRVTNIHQMAETVDMAIVLPGQTFSLNDYVGERTLEGGYVEAPGIFEGVLTPSVGGGTSQFTTTLYNAIFWGGYQDVEHKPHSYYFDRYPEGIEATLSWTSPDLKFRNNRSSAILIDTRFTDESITVRIFGNNDGRTLKGEQSGGQLNVWVDQEGGPDALKVRADVSDRFAETEPGDTRYVPNPELGVNQEHQVQSAQGGWTVTVTRTISKGDQVVETNEWVVRYAPRFEVIEVHPCKVPGSGVACPTTTTTTTKPPTTTAPTAPPSTEPPGTTVP